MLEGTGSNLKVSKRSQSISDSYLRSKFRLYTCIVGKLGCEREKATVVETLFNTLELEQTTEVEARETDWDRARLLCATANLFRKADKHTASHLVYMQMKVPTKSVETVEPFSKLQKGR